MLVLRNNQDLHVYLSGHPEPKLSGHKTYNVMNNFITNTSYTTSYITSKQLVWNQLITKEYHVISNVSTKSSNKELEGTLLNHLDMHISCGNEEC